MLEWGGARAKPPEDAERLRDQEEVSTTLQRMQVALGEIQASQERLEATIGGLPQSLSELLREQPREQPGRGASPTLAGNRHAAVCAAEMRTSIERRSESRKATILSNTSPTGAGSQPLVRTSVRSITSVSTPEVTLPERSAQAPSRGAVIPRNMKSAVARSTMSFAEDTKGPQVSFWPLDCLPIQKDSQFRTIFDAMSGIAVLWDLVFLPYQFSWDRWTTPMLYHGTMGTRWFWTIDLVLNFFTNTKTGAIDKERDTLKATAWRYIRGWFVVDVMLVVIDWTEFIVSIIAADKRTKSTNTLMALKAMRVARLIRIFRNFALMRTGHLDQLYETLIQKISRAGYANQVQLALSLVKMVAIILWFTHIGCCVWYRVAEETPAESAFGWMEQLEAYRVITDDGWINEMYVMGLYWSASTMLSGSSFLVPSSALSAGFSQATVIFGALLGSIVISSLAATLVQFEIAGQARMEKMRVLRRFLHEHAIDAGLSLEVQKQFRMRTAERRCLSFSDVPAFAVLSASMRSALRLIIYAPALRKHRVFGTLDKLDDSVMQDICTAAVTHTSASPGEELFQASSEMESACIVMSGNLRYSFANRMRTYSFMTSRGEADRSSLNGSQQSEKTDPNAKDITVHPGMWLCEIALWIHWFSKGLLEAETACEALLVHVDGMEKALLTHPECMQIYRDYASTVAEIIEKDHAGEIGDLQVGIDHEVIIASMPTESRSLMSTPALLTLRDRRWRGAKGVLRSGTRVTLEAAGKIEEQVKAGKVNLSLEDSGDVSRVVQVASLQLTSEFGVCVKLGDILDGNVVVYMTLLGAKVKAGELPQDALERLLDEDLAPLREGLKLEGHEVEHDTGACPEQRLAGERKGIWEQVGQKLVKTLFSGNYDVEHQHQDMIALDNPNDVVQVVMTSMSGERYHRRRRNSGTSASSGAPVSSQGTGRFFSWSPSMRSSGGKICDFKAEGWSVFGIRSDDRPNYLGVYAWVPAEEWRRMQNEDHQARAFILNYLGVTWETMNQCTTASEKGTSSYDVRSMASRNGPLRRGLSKQSSRLSSGLESVPDRVEGVLDLVDSHKDDNAADVGRMLV